MTTLQEHYADVVQQSQDAVTSAADAWTRSVTDVVGQLPAVPTQLDASQLVDQVFDFTERMLAVQRDLARTLVKTSASLAGSMAQRTRETAEALSDEG